jgi:hypothetical protein
MNASLVWFRRAPRLDSARRHALNSGGQAHCAGGFGIGRRDSKD